MSWIILGLAYEITESAAYSAHRHNKLIFVYAYILHIIVRRSFNRIPNLPLRAEFARYEFIQIREEQSPTVASSPLKPCTQWNGTVLISDKDSDYTANLVTLEFEATASDHSTSIYNHPVYIWRGHRIWIRRRLLIYYSITTSSNKLPQVYINNNTLDWYTSEFTHRTLS